MSCTQSLSKVGQIRFIVCLLVYFYFTLMRNKLPTQLLFSYFNRRNIDNSLNFHRRNFFKYHILWGDARASLGFHYAMPPYLSPRLCLVLLMSRSLTSRDSFRERLCLWPRGMGVSVSPLNVLFTSLCQSLRRLW